MLACPVELFVLLLSIAMAGKALLRLVCRFGKGSSWKLLQERFESRDYDGVLTMLAGEAGSSERPLRHFLAGACHQGKHEHALAIGELERALALEPDFEEAAAELGYAHLMAGDFSAAEAQFRRMLERRPGSSEARFGLACVHAKTGKYGEALSSVRSVGRLGEDDYLLHALEAHALAKIGLTAEAARSATRALELNPADRVSRRLLDDLNRPF